MNNNTFNRQYITTEIQTPTQQLYKRNRMKLLNNNQR